MLRQIPDLKNGVLGFEAVGKVTGGDYDEVMVPAVEAALQSADKVRLIYVLGGQFEGYTPDAAWEDTKIGIHHGSDFERIALVSDHRLYRDAVSVFGRAMSAEVRSFTTADLDAAKAWISA